MKPSLCCLIDFHLLVSFVSRLIHRSLSTRTRRALCWYTEAPILNLLPFSPPSLCPSVPTSSALLAKRPSFSWASDQGGSCYLPRRKGRETRCHQILLKSNLYDLSSSHVALPSSRHEMMGFNTWSVPFWNANIPFAFVARPHHVVEVRKVLRDKIVPVFIENKWSFLHPVVWCVPSEGSYESACDLWEKTPGSDTWNAFISVMF